MSHLETAYRLIARAVSWGEAAPSNADIARACGFTSTTTASNLVSQLEADGYITVQRSRRARVITLADGRSTAGTIRKPAAAAKPIPAPAPIRLVAHRAAAPTNPATRAIEALTPEACRYPLGDVRELDFRFCGRSARAGSSYCEEHHRLCHTVASLREAAE